MYRSELASTLLGTLMPLCLLSTTACAGVDVSLFDADALVDDPETVDCTLDTGETARCVKLVVRYKPGGLEIGPFCPRTPDDVGGIWNWDGEGAGLYRLDGDFFATLDALGLDFTDGQGNINISDPGAGAPEVDHACLEAGEDSDVEMTILLPLVPRMADAPTDLGTVAEVGLALDGVPIFADAPSVLETGHLPALDTCGGHIDPGGWYHWHATSTDLDTVYDDAQVDADCAQAQSTGARFGYAFDGFAMFGTTDPNGAVPADLDACGGHLAPTDASPDGEYHYHSTSGFPNLPACLSGVQAQGKFATTASAGIGAANGGGQGGPGGMPPGFAEAAAALGVSEEDLVQAVSDAGGRNLDIEKADAALGVTADELRAVLPEAP